MFSQNGVIGKVKSRIRKMSSGVANEFITFLFDYKEGRLDQIIVNSLAMSNVLRKGADPLKLASPKKNRNSKAGIDGPSGEKRKRKAVRKPVRVANVDDFKEAPKLNKQKAGAEKMLKTVKKAVKRKDGGGFPDLTGDGKVTKKDILKGRGVPGFSRGGGMAIQGLGFKGVR